jgi:hypothetical protein
MLEELRVWPLLSGFRGDAPADVDALIGTVLAIARVAAGVEDLAELELNPVIVHPAGEGCTVVDYVAVPNGNGDEMNTRTAQVRTKA